MPMTITIDKDQKKRLEVFSDVCKKAEGFCPVDNQSLFYFEDDTLEVFSTGAQGCIEVKLDAKSTSKDPEYFTVDLQKVVSAVKKVKNDDVAIKLDKNKVTIENPTKTKNFITLAVSAKKTPDEVKETRAIISSALSAFQDPVDVIVNEANRKIFETFSELTRLLDINDSFELTPEYVRASDHLFVASLKIDKDSIVKSDVLFNRNLSPVMKLCDEMKVTPKGQFLKMGPLGIRILFQPKQPRWQFPSDDDIVGITPNKKSSYAMKVGGKTFLDAVEQFTGMFDASAWKYQQVKIDVDGSDSFDMHFDDMSTEVNEQVSCEFVSNDTGEKSISIILPTLHLTKMKDFLEDEKVEVVLNGLPVDEPHGAATTFKTSKVELVIAKLIE